MGIVPEQIKCDHPGCNVTRQEVNHWFAVEVDEGKAVHIYEWDYAVAAKRLKRCKHFCGAAHAVHHISMSLGVRTSSSEEQIL